MLNHIGFNSPHLKHPRSVIGRGFCLSFACSRGLMCFAPLARSHLLPVGGGNGGRFVNRPYARNQSCACRAGACSRRGVRCKLTAGAKFSEFGHPFVCFADISPIRGITPPYPEKFIPLIPHKPQFVILRDSAGISNRTK